PINDFMIGKVMPLRLLLDGHGPYRLVVPDKRPKLFGVYLTLRFKPVGNALCLAVSVTVREIVEDIVIASKVAVYAFAFIVVTLPRSCYRASVDITKVEIELTARQRCVRNVFVR